MAPPDPADETAKVDSFPLSGGTGGARDEDEGGKGCMAKAGPPENSKQSIRFRYVNFAFAAGNNLLRIKGKVSILHRPRICCSEPHFFQATFIEKNVGPIPTFSSLPQNKAPKTSHVALFHASKRKNKQFLVVVSREVASNQILGRGLIVN